MLLVVDRRRWRSIGLRVVTLKLMLAISISGSFWRLVSAPAVVMFSTNMVQDDEELERIRVDYSFGKMTTGEIKRRCLPS